MSDKLTTDPNDPRLTHGVDSERVGQADAYLILSAEERAKGFVRPVRESYTHVGAPGPKHPLRELTPDERDRYAAVGYVSYEQYPEGSDITGTFWTQARLDNVGKGCGTSTRMGTELSETYAANPAFYGATYCVGCSKHLPVAEFTWDEDGSVVGS